MNMTGLGKKKQSNQELLLCTFNKGLGSLQ